MVYPSRFSRPSHRSAGLGGWWGSPGTGWFVFAVALIQLVVLMISAVDVVWRLAAVGGVVLVAAWMLATRLRGRG